MFPYGKELFAFDDQYGNRYVFSVVYGGHDGSNSVTVYEGSIFTADGVPASKEIRKDILFKFKKYYRCRERDVYVL